MPFDGKKRYAIAQRYNETIGKDIPQNSGIYLWTRQENGITYFYVGQAKNLHKRRFDYYCIQCGLTYPTRHFEASLKKHKDGKYSILIVCDESRLNELEKQYITEYLKMPNYVTRNELLAGKDQVKSNANRIQNVYTKYENKIYKCLKKLNWGFGDESNPEISFGAKENKQKGTYNKVSMNAFNELKQGFREIIENGKKETN